MKMNRTFVNANGNVNDGYACAGHWTSWISGWAPARVMRTGVDVSSRVDQVKVLADVHVRGVDEHDDHEHETPQSPQADNQGVKVDCVEMKEGLDQLLSLLHEWDEPGLEPLHPFRRRDHEHGRLK